MEHKQSNGEHKINNICEKWNRFKHIMGTGILQIWLVSVDS